MTVQDSWSKEEEAWADWKAVAKARSIGASLALALMTVVDAARPQWHRSASSTIKASSKPAPAMAGACGRMFCRTSER